MKEDVLAKRNALERALSNKVSKIEETNSVSPCILF